MDLLAAIPGQIRPFILPIAGALAAVAGLFWMFGGFSPELLARAKGALTHIVVGAIIAFGGATLLLLFLSGIGVGK